MAYSGFPHHKIILQTLYSSRANWSKALRHGYSIAQARADVFFSLLFGGQVCFSAGAFFDSPISVRVFGELCSHPKFDSTCRDYGWRPLSLNTDTIPGPNGASTSAPSPVDFILSRWRNPKMSFTFFRESEPCFDPERLRIIKERASDALELGQYGTMADVLSPLFQKHRIVQIDPSHPSSAGDELSPVMADDHGDQSLTNDAPPGFAPDAETPAILTEGTGSWFKGLITYLSTYKEFEDRSTTKRPSALSEFFPVSAVIERTKNIDGVGKLYLKEELERLNKEFVDRFGNPPTMNPVHIEGPAHYGHYYPLIDYWMETEWLATRHRMYGSDTCILSSDWQMRDIFDFDRHSMATYLDSARIDDSLRVAQEGFGELSWDVLFETITDSRWRSLLFQMRSESNPAERRLYADKILELLASKLVDFHLEHEGGLVSIGMKKMAGLGYISAYAGMVLKHHSTLEGLLGTNLALGVETIAAPIGLVAAESGAVRQMTKPFVKGAKYLFSRFKGRQLRRAIVTDTYNARIATSNSEIVARSRIRETPT